MDREIELKLQKLVDEKRKIPKPETDNEFRILRVGRRRNQTAIIYSIPSHTNENSHYEKGITYSEFSRVLDELSTSGYVTRSWFYNNLPECAKEGSCNFTSLCGILELLGYCKYSEKGKYEAVRI